MPGHEGVFRVAAAGAGVQHLREGDRAVPLAPALGTWRARGAFDAADWHAVPAALPDAAAATLCIKCAGCLLLAAQGPGEGGKKFGLFDGAA